MNLKYCDNCEVNVVIKDLTNLECPQCFNSVLENAKDDNKINNSSLDDAIDSIELIYQSNGNKININCSNRVNILGRNGIGNELLSAIMFNNRPVISREHCQVEYESDTNTVFIKDLNSTNGTFINDNICTEKTELRNQSIIKLGRELFIVNFIHKANSLQELKEDIEVVITNQPINFYCPECNENFKKDGFCENCDVKLEKE
ncbi:hypothetical protein BFP78_00120 [Gaetbulibacter sp. 5U11]|nr:hypothetical protein BFP78_00120 [Gaetbulibacter sp. 5U11]